jgi:hypothetical protein
MAEIKSEPVADFIPESVADFPRNTHVQHPDPRKIEEWTRQAAAPSRHEMLVGLGIGG